VWTQSEEHRDQCETRQQHGPAHNATRLMDKRKNMTPQREETTAPGGEPVVRAPESLCTRTRVARVKDATWASACYRRIQFIKFTSRPETTVEYRKRDIHNKLAAMCRAAKWTRPRDEAELMFGLLFRCRTGAVIRKVFFGNGTVIDVTLIFASSRGSCSRRRRTFFFFFFRPQ